MGRGGFCAGGSEERKRVRRFLQNRLREIDAARNHAEVEHFLFEIPLRGNPDLLVVAVDGQLEGKRLEPGVERLARADAPERPLDCVHACVAKAHRHVPVGEGRHVARRDAQPQRRDAQPGLRHPGRDDGQIAEEPLRRLEAKFLGRHVSVRVAVAGGHAHLGAGLVLPEGRGGVFDAVGVPRLAQRAVRQANLAGRLPVEVERARPVAKRNRGSADADVQVDRANQVTRLAALEEEPASQRRRGRFDQARGVAAHVLLAHHRDDLGTVLVFAGLGLRRRHGTQRRCDQQKERGRKAACRGYGGRAKNTHVR